MAKIALALDVEDLDLAKNILREIKDYKIIVKIGYLLFIKGGVPLIDFVKNLGFEIFLDLKLHDIPNTVYNGVRSASELGIDYLTIHALGGREMLIRAVEGKKNNLKLLAVSILTSHSDDYLDYIGTKYSLDDLVLKLAKTSLECGVDGLVSSALEVKKLKSSINKDFLAVVPGIRLDKTAKDDQNRVATPEEAVKNGADILVIGRPILKSEDKKKTIEFILKEIDKVK
ncbi:MAG: orotidine-5'-phosphate decarboxylase [Persephonella sp.]|nr:MAG: orotidine-5'-phosphate decarboxylase [Persephonella sp.]RUM60306.1 MAG: orotidine-5'-phosphate decarboxylase [Persephonella sp.]